MSDHTQDQVFVHRIAAASIGGDFSLAREYADEVAAELTALRKQVADLRAALLELDDVIHFDLPWQRDARKPVRVNAMNAAMARAARVLAATQPQEVQG